VSVHALLLAEDRYSYRTLRDRLDQIPADVCIAVLDACASGAFTRRKGGRVRAPFLVDESASMRGYAFLTSNTEGRPRPFEGSAAIVNTSEHRYNSVPTPISTAPADPLHLR